MSRTVADLLAASRRRAVCGRAEEVALIADVVDDPTLVLGYVHGPGGVGKTTLLDAVVDRLASTGRPVMLVDAADIEPTAAGLSGAVSSAAAGTADQLSADAVLLIDRFEALESLAAWFWRHFLGTLPAGVHVVVTGRRPPDPTWTADPAFATRARVLPLRNLDPAAAIEVLARRGVEDPDEAGVLAAVTHGHPLALVIAVDVHRSGAGLRPGGTLFDHPDAVARLLGAFLDEGVTPLQRQALHLCGHARRVDRGLLREVFRVDEETADDLLDWLRARPYAESHPDGLAVHDLVRDTLDHDLAWRDREAFAALHNRLRDRIVALMSGATGADHVRYANDLLFLHRGNPRSQDLYSFETLGSAVSRPLADDPGERDWVVESFAEEYRSAQAAFWIERAPDSWTIVEDALGERVGAILSVAADRVPDAPEHDPVLAYALDAVAPVRPVEPGEVVLHQMALDVTRPGRTGLVSDQAAAVSLRDWATPGLGWLFVSSVHEDVFAPMWTYVGLERLGTCVHGGGRIGVWGRDFSRSPYAEWLAGMGARELDESGTVPPPVAAPVALSRTDFATAVRRLLKDINDPELVRGSPLIDSRLAASPVPADRAQALRSRVRDAVAHLGRAPDGAEGATILQRTYLRPLASQHTVATSLHISHSTYRRRLADAIERLEALLWDWELHGVPDPADHDLTTG